MSAVAIQSQSQIEHATHLYVISGFIYNASGDTVSVPTGTISAAVLTGFSSATAPSVSISAGATNDTVTLTGGTVGAGMVLVTRHAGTLAGTGAR
jgi:hypothetical protein